VDDERLLSELLAASLSAKSHTVVTAFNGEEGLRKFLEGDFDLVITDQSMPKMDGTRLAAAIKEAKPAQPVILISGRRCKPEPGGVDLVLMRPVCREELDRAIAQTLAARNCARGPKTRNA
jgi:DNA-binding response OmpR family regulator